ncbi:lytic polysaccharide monooxygenase [Enterobacter mori]|uniref:lytic polysaccharide monooxygenase n=1 Tax=Enterobacter mori TaxID=539813 RepID=UPI002B1F7B1C|nr:lytic polysaccharide monooxygenase [Enterobacter mori]MEA5206375.1 lytic polysaccharide monooxygenase [Enterobacter mori]
MNVYGFDGLDIDLEQAAITAGENVTVIPNALIKVKQRLMAEGRHFIISMAPEFPYLRKAGKYVGPNRQTLHSDGKYLDYLHALDGYYDFIAPQFYNQGGDGIWDEENNQWLAQDVDEGDYKKRFLIALTKALVRGTGGYTRIDPQRFAIGLPSNNDAAATGYSSSASNVTGALEALADAGLAIRGLMTWSVNWDDGWDKAGTPYGGEFAARYGYMTGEPGQRPPAPSDLHAQSVGETYCTLSWSPVNEALSYRLYRDGVHVGTTATTLLSDESLSPGTQYRYEVTAVDSAGRESRRSHAVNVLTGGGTQERPNPPTSLCVAQETYSVITIRWTASAGNPPASGYRIERDGQVMGTVTMTEFADMGLEPDTSYTYAVYAVAANGNSSISAATVTGHTLPPAGERPWAVDVTYVIGATVIYDGMSFECLARHTSKKEWTPAAATSLWKSLGHRHRRLNSHYKGRLRGIEPFHGGVFQPPSRASLEFGRNSWIVYSLEAGKCYPMRSAPGEENDPDWLTYQDDVSAEPPADGKIASGGFPQAAILDRPDIDWPRHEVETGQLLDIYWDYHAVHLSRRWRYFLTHENWDSSQPLTRASFEESPFHIVQLEEHPHWSHIEALTPPEPTHHQLRLPERQGYHVLLAVWDVANTGNAFFQVIDLQFVGDSLPQLPSPVNVRIGNTTSRTIEVLWDKPGDVQSVDFYSLYRNGRFLVKIEDFPLQHIDAGLESNTDYQYSVTLTINGQESPHSPLVTGRTSDDGVYRPPGAPQGLHIMNITARSVVVMWTASSGGSAGVQYHALFRGGTEVSQIVGGGNAYTDITVQPSSRYQYFVAALDERGVWSVPGNVLWVETPDDEGGSDVPRWNANSVRYELGDEVRYDNRPEWGDGESIYRCIFANTSNAGWNPVDAFTLWERVRPAR